MDFHAKGYFMRLDSLGLAKAILDDMAQSAPAELKGGWDDFDVRVGLLKGKSSATLYWPSWRLEVCTFLLPETYEGEPTTIETSDSTYMSAHNEIHTRSHANDKSQDWDQLVRAPVVEIIDSFLEGTWTPPWRCGFCRDRILGTSKPKW